MSTWREEFPDITDMPAIPESFEDTSWHNDACPSYTSDVLGLSVWIDYAKIEDRECGEPKRYSLYRMISGIEMGMWVLNTDNWHEILNAIEAIEICTKWVAVLGLGFHPDTRGRSYVESHGGDEPFFTAKQAREYDDDMERLFDLGGDPYEFGIVAMKNYEVRESERAHADKVAKEGQQYL